MNIVVKCESCDVESEMIEKYHDRVGGLHLEPPDVWWSIPGHHKYTCSFHCVREWLRTQKKGQLYEIRTHQNSITNMPCFSGDRLITNDLAALVEQDFFEVLR